MKPFIEKQVQRIVVVFCTVALAGCGGLRIVPDDCTIFIARNEALALLSLAESGRDNGVSESEALGVLLRECAGASCQGAAIGGGCYVACTACADALVTLVYP